MKRIRILLADDHAVVRQGFKMILSAQADMEIVGRGRQRAGGGGTRRAVEARYRGDGCRDAGAERDRGHAPLVAALPHTRVIALSMHKDSVYVREILRAGARGYLLKDSGADDLVRAIRAVAGGES